MDNQLFRKKSIERISSPEALHDYMRVTSPRLWMILSAIIALLIGFVIYASTATMESTIPIRVTAISNDSGEETDGEASADRRTYYFASLPLSMKDSVATGMVVRIGEESGKISLMTMIGDDTEEDGEIGLVITMDDAGYSLPDAEYDAVLVLESTTPISFLWN